MVGAGAYSGASSLSSSTSETVRMCARISATAPSWSPALTAAGDAPVCGQGVLRASLLTERFNAALQHHLTDELHQLRKNGVVGNLGEGAVEHLGRRALRDHPGPPPSACRPSASSIRWRSESVRRRAASSTICSSSTRRASTIPGMPERFLGRRRRTVNGRGGTAARHRFS